MMANPIAVAIAIFWNSGGARIEDQIIEKLKQNCNQTI